MAAPKANPNPNVGGAHGDKFGSLTIGTQDPPGGKKIRKIRN
jgi:hypothetical protein